MPPYIEIFVRDIVLPTGDKQQHSNLLVPPIDLCTLESLMLFPSFHMDPHPSLKIVLSKCMLQVIKKTQAN